MDARSLHLANHDDLVADVGRDVSARISHVSALLQQLALRGRFAGPAAPAAAHGAAAVHQNDVDILQCETCGSKPCQCDLDSRNQLKDDYLNAGDATVREAGGEASPGRLVSADQLQRDALDVWLHHQHQQWAESMRTDLADSAELAGDILADTTADSAAVLAAARVVVWDTQLAAEAARHSEAVVQAAEAWQDRNASDRWAHYLPDSADLALLTEQRRSTWLDEQLREVIPALQRGDAAAPLAGPHATLHTNLREVAALHDVEQGEQGYQRLGTLLTGGPHHGDQVVEDDIDDRIADIAAWQQRAAADDRDPSTIPTTLNSAAIAKARQTRAHSRLIDSDGDVKEAAGHEATDHRAPQPLRPIRPVADHLTEQDPTPDIDLTDPTRRLP